MIENLHSRIYSFLFSLLRIKSRHQMIMHKQRFMDNRPYENHPNPIPLSQGWGIYGFRILRDTVGKPARRSKIRSGGYHEFENTITLADAQRDGADREEFVR
jgi:hypothetical protein